jgi:hypothetical protein
MHYVTVRYISFYLSFSAPYFLRSTSTNLFHFVYLDLRRFLFNHFLFLFRYTFIAVVQSVPRFIYLSSLPNYLSIFFYPSYLQLTRKSVVFFSELLSSKFPLFVVSSVSFMPFMSS